MGRNSPAVPRSSALSNGTSFRIWPKPSICRALAILFVLSLISFAHLILFSFPILVYYAGLHLYVRFVENYSHLQYEFWSSPNPNRKGWTHMWYNKYVYVPEITDRVCMTWVSLRAKKVPIFHPLYSCSSWTLHSNMYRNSVTVIVTLLCMIYIICKF